jgi:hypothetical protein
MNHPFNGRTDFNQYIGPEFYTALISPFIVLSENNITYIPTYTSIDPTLKKFLGRKRNKIKANILSKCSL